MDREEKLKCMVDVLETLMWDEDFEEALALTRARVAGQNKTTAEVVGEPGEVLL